MAAILGQEGRVQLTRDYPDPERLTPDALNGRLNAVEVFDTALWTGDRVLAYCERGLPTDKTPRGSMAWKGVGYNYVAPSRVHLVDDDSPFWISPDSRVIWDELGPDDTIQEWYYVNIDEFERLSLYRTRADAINGAENDRLPLLRADWGELVLMAQPDQPYALNAAIRPGETYDLLPYDYGAVTEEVKELFRAQWRFACNLRSWSIETNSQAIDTTPIGVRFGEAVKSLITGGGNLEFMIDRRQGAWSGLDTMRLALLTDKGAKARAEFFLTIDDSDGGCETGAAIYYTCDILLTTCSLSVRIDEAIIGNVSYATTGAIRLRVGTAIS